MALDFPASPIDGQVYQHYYWSAAKNTWLMSNSVEAATARIDKFSTYPVVTGSAYVNTDAPTTYANNSGNFSQMWQNSGTNAIGVALGDNLKAGLVTNNGYSLSLGSYANDYLLINSSGQVRKPYQPSFKAYNSTFTQINNPTYGTNLVFDNVSGVGGHNIGNHYNPSTGYFTAPVDGEYMFAMHMLMNKTPSGNTYAWVGLCINDTFAHYNGHTHTGYWAFEGSPIILSLAANDRVNYRIYYGSGHYGQSYSWFTGALLS